MYLRLIRHGESVANKEGRLQGQSDFPLSETGREQAQRLACWLAQEKIDALYSSDLSRAYVTAETIARYHSLPVLVSKELREIKLGRFEALTPAEIKARYPHLFPLDYLSCGLDDVEQANQVFRRALRFMETLLHRHWGERVVAVSHGTFIGCLVMALLGIPWPGRRLFSIGNTGITTIRFDSPQEFIILGVNERPHLEGPVKAHPASGHSENAALRE